MLVESLHIFFRIGLILHVPRKCFALGVKENDIVNRAEMLRTLTYVTVGCLPFPDDLVHKLASPEYFIEYGLNVVGDTPSHVNIDRTIVCEKVAHQLKAV